MYRMIRRMLLAAAVGLAAVGTATAQQAAPSALPVVQAPAAPQSAAPAAQAKPMAQPGAPATLTAPPLQPGCCGAVAPPCGCDPCHGGRRHSLHSWFANNPFTIGAGCANSVGCTSLAAQRTFAFGSCNQFFNPGNKCGLGFGGCATGPIGTGISSCGPCVYGSYLNR